MLGTAIFDKYSVDTQTKTSDWFTVYAGQATGNAQKVTVLALHPALAPLKELLPPLEATSKKLAAIPPGYHPAWLQTGEAAGAAVIVCAAIGGESLAGRLAASGGSTPEEVIELAYRLGKYLEALHSQNLFQGVFDPQELVQGDEQGAPLVTNPALANFLDLPKLLTSGALPDRPYYAPELAAGQPVTARSDIYSLGALLFEALTAQPVPRPDLSPGKTMIVTWLPSRLRRDIPPALDELVATCLHPDPGQRYPSLAHFMNAVNDQRAQTLPSPSMMGMEDSLVGQTLGAYRLVERLGQGGMATVYKAYEPALNRYVAVKVLPQFFANDPNFSVRFRREAKAIAQLNHPNIVPIYSYGESNGITYIAMQHVEGGTLKHERGEKMDHQSALRLLLPITRALGYAHQRGIIHRDVKPSNVLLGADGWPLLADFGLARMAEGSSEKLTGTGVGMGTPMYMSPEQGQGVNVDQRSDIYSLGIMLYEFVTGDVPFRADTPMAIVIKHMTAPMPLPRAIDPSIPEAVEIIILKATAKEAAGRYQTAEEMAEAMEAVLLGVPAATHARTSAPQAEAVGLSSSKPAAAGRPPAPARVRSSGAKKPLRGVLFGVLGLLGFCLLAVILMGVFDICPPQGPWPQPPWCPGSPFQFSFGNAPAPAPTSTSELQAPSGAGEYDHFGMLLLQDDFDGAMLPRWQFTCDPHTSPWILDEIDGRTVLHSQPPSPPGDVSCAEYRDTDWQDYTIETNFKFQQPDQFGVYYFSLSGRITSCPPNIQSVQEYILVLTETGIQIRKSSCVPAIQSILTEITRPIDPGRWHLLQYIFIGNRIQVWLDEEKWLDYSDETDPIAQGGDLWFSTNDSAEILLDDLKVYEVIPAEGAAAPVPATSIPAMDAEAMMYGSTVLAAIQGRDPNLTDSFDQAGGWYGFTGETTSPNMVSVQDGVIRARNDTTPGGVHMTSAAIQQLRNFVVMVEATFMESGSSPGDRAIGICWWPGDDLGDRFLLYESGRFEGGTCQNNECPTFVTGQIDPIAPGERVALTLISGLGKSGLIVNGTPLAYQKLDLQDFTSGFSLCPHEYDGQPSGIAYDNLRVWNLDLIPNLPLP